MTTDKARKRAVRDRMTKTGESYTAARRQLAGPAPAATPEVASPEPIPAPLPPRVAEPEVSEEAILRGTGRSWDDWLRVLDARGVEGFSHRDAAAWLREELGVDGWWAQSITVGFERARGLRAAHQVADGFSVGVSKTLAVGAERLWAAFADEEARSRWLDPGVLRLRTAQPARSARFDAEAGRSRVNVYLTAKAPAKTSVTVQHERLASAAEVETWRAFWRGRLAALGTALAAEGAADATQPDSAIQVPGAVQLPGVAPSPLDEFLAGVDPGAGGLVAELDRLVRAAAPELDVAIKYRMLTYALDARWRQWVAAISVSKDAVNLRLLYGTRLEAGIGVLRPGSSHLANLDIRPGSPVDGALVRHLIREAVDRHPELVAAETAAGD
jgi:hypothetical protein